MTIASMKTVIAAALALPALLALAAPAAAAEGERLFNLQCKSCHGAKSTPMGPTLAAVFGADIAGRADFNYSAGLKAKDGTWTVQALDSYLAKPMAFAPGTRMMVAVPSETSRAQIIDYLKTLK